MDSFLQWWQHLPERIDPVFLQLGSVQIRYYGLMYFTSFLVAYTLLLYRAKKEKGPFTKNIVEDYATWAIIGVLLGSRLGYVLFYNLGYFLEHPLEIFLPFQIGSNGFQYTGISGMSYHGGLIGVAVATIWFCRKMKLNVLGFGDFLVSAVPLGYMFGRIGNFLNGELYGRVTHVAWGMYFPGAETYDLRHPSQLYEAFFEGAILFCLLWTLRKQKFFNGFLVALYLIGYGIVRFFIENFRQPDDHLGFIIGSLTMGQILCSVMILAGALMIIGSYYKVKDNK